MEGWRPAGTAAYSLDLTVASIFMSYAREDRSRAEPLVRALEAKGWSVFWDPEIPPGYCAWWAACDKLTDGVKIFSHVQPEGWDLMYEHGARRLEHLEPRKHLRLSLPRCILLACLTSLACASSLPAQGDTRRQQVDRQMQEQQNVAVYTQSPREVIDALTAVLVARGELPAAQVSRLGTSVMAAVAERQQGQISSQSVDLNREELERLVPEEYRRYVGDEGGRYVLSIIVQPEGESGTRVTVVPTIIVTIPGAEGPLGGRVVRSNRTLETAVFQAMAARLGGDL